MAIANSTNLRSDSAEFVVADWVLNTGKYELDVQHNLDSVNINTAIWENGTEQVFVSRVSVVNNNTVKLYVTADPDCRFSGKIIIFRVQG